MKLIRIGGAILTLLLTCTNVFALGFCTGSWTKQTPAAAPAARWGEVLAFDSGRGVTLLFGGQDNNGTVFGDTWQWDGTNWAQKTLSNSPPPASFAAMAYDSGRGVAVMFGGDLNNSPIQISSDTWEWNGTAWNRRSLATSPSARIGHAMAYDAGRGVTVLYGGITINGSNAVFLGDTWEWDGTNWTQKVPAASPPILGLHAMAYDSLRQRVVLFGGSSVFPTQPSDETWEWDGTTWLQRTPSIAPPARTGHGMAYDSKRAMTVIFGGTDGTNDLDDTWEWDGTFWRKRLADPASPSARQEPSMAYDTVRDAVVLFGGQLPGNDAIGETWQWVGPSVFITQQPASQSVVAGQSATFTVAADGAGPPFGGSLSFNWRKNGTLLTDGGSISGSLTATLTVNPAQPTNAGAYDCVVTNNCGTMISAAATLDTCKPATAAEDCNANGVLDSCDIAANPALDANHNGLIDSCEPAPPAQSTTPDTQGTPDSGSGSQDVLSTQAMPCGTCGGGAAGMMPLALLSLSVRRRRVRPRKSIDY